MCLFTRVYSGIVGWLCLYLQLCSKIDTSVLGRQNNCVFQNWEKFKMTKVKVTKIFHSVRGGAHTRCVKVSSIHEFTQRYESRLQRKYYVTDGNGFEIGNGMMFDFYPGLPHILRMFFKGLPNILRMGIQISYKSRSQRIAENMSAKKFWDFLLPVDFYIIFNTKVHNV